ncbi:MAG TPA: transketolase [Bacilli bacterium]|nr:transketolase [Bacilli bacterium]HPT88810.1 transketolase [Bacilli bacterium]HQA19264.1 transketolase [Bacilli bacterium]HQD91778.1 transketolase [Bacilli bacterium]
MKTNIERKAIETIKTLSLEQINQAKSGHPGICLGAAPIIHTLFAHHLKVLPEKGGWFNRDRFVLSAGHGSALLYSMLHLIGFGVSVSDLQKFRQLGSITPGHPEYELTPGVEATTGPLGQGISMAVGMAIAEEFLAAKYNEKDVDVVNHYTYVLCGDGDLQEGVAQEAISLAGHLGLGKLIVLYDSNDVQLDTLTHKTTSENVKMKFEALNWHYELVEDGTDIESISNAIIKAQNVTDKPSIIEIKTVIGLGSSLAGTPKVHGSPLPSSEVENFRKNLGGKEFTVDTKVYEFYYNKITLRGRKEYENWQNKLSIYKLRYPEKYQEFLDIMENNIKVDLNVDKLNFDLNYSAATRVSSGIVLDYISTQHPTIIGGSADLSSSTKAKGADGDFSKENRTGRNINFGVREHAMAAICNGMALHGGVRAFCGGFLVFADYMKPAIRLSALMKLPVIFIFTHDSIAVGEDGPTHQPIEHLTMLRTIPNMTVIRPADANEVKSAWNYIINDHLNGPVCLILTRQDVPTLTKYNSKAVPLGAYTASPERERLDGIIIATGSELQLAMEAQKRLLKDGHDVRVVSMPSSNLFERQTYAYKEQLIPAYITKRLIVEMSEGSSLQKYAGSFGEVYSISGFGSSAPGRLLVSEYGYTVDKIVEAYKNLPNIEIHRYFDN